jgi:16S rRNA (cytidine1402-2'-O)-methyltransferase
LGETEISNVLPSYNKEVILPIRHFIVENVRTARRFLKQAVPEISIDDLTFYTLNKHTSKEELSGFLKPIEAGFPVGIISEAGCPAIADPGADIVAIAQQKNIRVIPLVGPSSILLALMASGFNGQSFAFLGYLPIDQDQRVKTLKLLEQRIYAEDQTQLFIETPYRNGKMLEDILKTCKPATKLCIAADITLESEFIKTKSITEWKKQIPELSKRPCIFALYK